MISAWRQLLFSPLLFCVQIFPALLATPTQCKEAIIRFDEPQDLEKFEILKGPAPTLEVSGGVLKATVEGKFMLLVGLKDWTLMNGTVSCRVRILPENQSPPVGRGSVKVGIAYRLQSRPDVLGFPGYYTFIQEGPALLFGGQVDGWIDGPAPPRRAVPDGERLIDLEGVGTFGMIPGWDGKASKDWIIIRSKVIGGRHWLYAGTQTPLSQAVYQITLKGDEREAVSNRKDMPPIALPFDPYPAGRVGLFFWIEYVGAQREIQIDDFEVSEDVTPLGKVATMWGMLKSKR